MMGKQLWGSIEEPEEDYTALQNVNFDTIIGLAMQHIPSEEPTTLKIESYEYPKSNEVTHTVALHRYASQLRKTLNSNVFEGASLDLGALPPSPQAPEVNCEHGIKTPLNFLEKDYCEFSLGKGHKILPFTQESHQRILKQIAALTLAHLGIQETTKTVITTLAETLDHYLTTMTQLLRTVVDQEASGLNTGFPDAIQKVFTEMRVENLHEFYQTRVINYKNKMKNECMKLSQKCQELVVPDIAPQLKLEDVPELHFPAALSEVFTPSLEPGFQMLHSLEQEELQSLELLDTVSQEDMKIDVIEYTQNETSPSIMSPKSKKKRK